MHNLRIVADDAIPFVLDCFGRFGDVELIPGQEIDLRSIKDADVLLVRSITKVDKSLLDGSGVRFVGSATAGTDHIDTDYLRTEKIRFASAPGGNAVSVVEYLICAMLEIATRAGKLLRSQTLGIVGCGAIGSILIERARGLGMRTLHVDPFLEQGLSSRDAFSSRTSIPGNRHDRQRESHMESEKVTYHSLEDVIAECDVLSLNVPLTENGPHPTRRLINSSILKRSRRGLNLLQSSRGGVVHEKDLIQAMDEGQVANAVIDVWENEPLPRLDLLGRAFLGTAHIAGYSIDAKYQSTMMIQEAFVDFLASLPGASTFKASGSAERRMESEQFQLVAPTIDPIEYPELYLRDLARQMYDIRADDALLRQSQEKLDEERARSFRRLRSQYAPRYTFGRFRLQQPGLDPDTIALLKTGLGLGDVQTS